MDVVRGGNLTLFRPTLLPGRYRECSHPVVSTECLPNRVSHFAPAILTEVPPQGKGRHQPADMNSRGTSAGKTLGRHEAELASVMALPFDGSDREAYKEGRRLHVGEWPSRGGAVNRVRP